MNTWLADNKAQIKTAQTNVDRLKYARGFFETRPPVLDCLRELSLAFGENDRAWVSTFVLPQNGKGTITGRAADDGTILAVVDRLKKNPKFIDVKGPNTQQADARTREVTFTVTFTFASTESAAAMASASPTTTKSATTTRSSR
jgi:hypothetical protein